MLIIINEMVTVERRGFTTLALLLGTPYQLLSLTTLCLRSTDTS